MAIAIYILRILTTIFVTFAGIFFIISLCDDKKNYLGNGVSATFMFCAAALMWIGV